MAVFGLRDSDPRRLLTGLRGFGLLNNREDPRDIMIASARLIYVAEKFGIDPQQLVEDSWIYHPWMKRWFLDVASREREIDWHLKHWGFREIHSELGIGLINSSGHYHPELDLVKLAMRICRIVESDEDYLSTSLQIDRPAGDSLTPYRGFLQLRAHPNPDAHPEMKKQLLHFQLVEFESAEQARQFTRNYKITSEEVGFVTIHEKLALALRARSWVAGAATVETEASIQRFREPMAAVVGNFHRYRWQPWQAFESDGCITLTPKGHPNQLQHRGPMPSDARLLYEFTAATGEEASTIHHERQGWESYRPIGKPKICPEGCGSYYYPKGSGDCPVCGPLG
jgi:hypothetical protein